MTARRSDPSHAGRMCVFANPTHVCMSYGRYVVIPSAPNLPVKLGTGSDSTENGVRTCGAHLPYAIRHVWKTSNSAAIVQEIPGMWRDQRDHNIIQQENVA